MPSIIQVILYRIKRFSLTIKVNRIWTYVYELWDVTFSQMIMVCIFKITSFLSDNWLLSIEMPSELHQLEDTFHYIECETVICTFPLHSLKGANSPRLHGGPNRPVVVIPFFLNPDSTFKHGGCGRHRKKGCQLAPVSLIDFGFWADLSQTA